MEVFLIICLFVFLAYNIALLGYAIRAREARQMEQRLRQILER
jgi:hypothetical protein